MPVFSPQHGLHPVHPDSSPMKPRVVTVVKLGPHPLRKITLLLNRRSVQTFEQLLADISEALGFPRWKNDRVRKLFTLKGREIRSVSDFFREGDAFIAMGKDPLTLKSMQLAAEALYPSKGRSLTLTQHSRAPSPRLRSRLYSRALRWGHHCGEAETLKGSSGEAAGPTAAVRQEGKSPLGPTSDDRARGQRKWVRGKWEPGLPRDATLEERHASGEKHLGLEIEKTSGEIIRCEKCKRERELQQQQQQQGPQRERLSLGTSELDLGTRHSYEVEKLVRTRSCRRSPEAATEDGPRARNPAPELRRPCRSSVKKEDRELEAAEGAVPVAAATKAKKDPGEARPVGEEGLREGRKDPRGAGRGRPGPWLQREQLAEAEKPPRPHEEEPEAEKEKRPAASGGRRARVSREEEPPAKAEKEPRPRPEESKTERPSGRKQRPGGIIAADVEKHYDTGKVIGDGNFAVVKECRHRETQQAYAMKIIDKAKLRGKEDIVDSEISIIQSLSHPNIVKLHQVYETEKEIYLIMEYVQGGDLFDAIMESVKFPEREAALMLLDLCQALVHMHDKGIVHRDLKPENLLVQRNEDKSTTLKLADFGLAKHVVRPIFTVCGTPTYVAPEILSERGYGLEVDLWAAGVILYILLCGFPPFRSPERDQDELFNIIQQGHFEFLAPYWDNISDAAKDLVSRLLVVDPKKRYTAHQVLQHPWIESARKSSMVRLPKEVPPSGEGHSQVQHKRVVEQATL